MMLKQNINNCVKWAFALLVMVAVTSGCSDSDEAPPESGEVLRVFDLLSGSEWQVSDVQVDDLDFTSTYPGLRITFQEGSYTSVNGNALFSPSGSWNFTSSSAEKISFDGRIEADIIEISETALVIGFVWTENTIGTGGKTESVSGNHVISFSK